MIKQVKIESFALSASRLTAHAQFVGDSLDSFEI